MAVNTCSQIISCSEQRMVWNVLSKEYEMLMCKMI